ncbi:DUF4352 domain-containing protein [Streptomyces acidicola]|nr:DUF4352 domain-containing protein [Streptomyces acidicola]
MSQNVTPPMPGYEPPTAPPAPNKNRTVLIATAAAVAAAAIAATITAGVTGNSEASPAPTVTVTETAAPEADTAEAEDAATTTVETDFKVGEKADNGGAVVKITKVVESNTITLAGAQKNAGDGAKYVTLKTVVTNETKASMDLTCSLPIVSALIDDQDRRYDTIENLYEVADNPECNAQLQPGFKDDMQFVYRVPKDAKITMWEFYPYDLENEPTPTLVDLT